MVENVEQTIAVNKISYQMVRDLDYDECIELTKYYELTRYSIENTGTIYLVNTETQEEELAVQIDTENEELIFTEL